MKSICAEEIIDGLSDDFQDLLVREACVRRKEQALRAALAEKRAQAAAQAQTRPAFLVFRKGAKEDFDAAAARCREEIRALEEALENAATIQKKCSRIFAAELERTLEARSASFRDALAARKIVPEWEQAVGLYRSCLRQFIMALGIARNQMASGYDRRSGSFAPGAVEAFGAAAAAARALEMEVAIPNRLARRHRELLGLDTASASFGDDRRGLPDLEIKATAKDIGALKSLTLEAAQKRIGALLEQSEKIYQDQIPHLLEERARVCAAEQSAQEQLVTAPLTELRALADASADPAHLDTIFAAMEARFVHLTG